MRTRTPKGTPSNHAIIYLPIFKSFYCNKIFTLYINTIQASRLLVETLTIEFLLKWYTVINYYGGLKMLRWAILFFIISVIAALLGFTGIAAASAGIAKILFVLFFLIFCLLLLGVILAVD